MAGLKQTVKELQLLLQSVKKQLAKGQVGVRCKNVSPRFCHFQGHCVKYVLTLEFLHYLNVLKATFTRLYF